MTLLTYNSDPALKEQFLAEIEKHRLADQIVQGSYGDTEDFTRGCGVGCSVHSINMIRSTHYSVSDHAAYEEIGIPEWLAYVEDGLFEALPADAAQLWPTRLANAIPVGVSLDGVKDRFMLWVLVDPTWGVVNTNDAPDVISAIRGVADCYHRRIDGDEPTEEQWEKAGDAARDAWAARAARDAAWAARDAARDARDAARAARDAAWAAWAARAARDAAWAAWAARAARDAAWAARDAARDARAAWDAARAARDARDAFVTASCDELIRLLESAGQVVAP